jgi:hypothetical protein
LPGQPRRINELNRYPFRPSGNGETLAPFGPMTSTRPLNLQSLATTYRLKIDLDPSAELDTEREIRPWYIRVSGRHGFISPWSSDRLAVFCSSTRLFDRLLSIPDVTPIQVGDQELRATFPPSRLEEVATAIKARRKRSITDEQRRHLASIGSSGRFPRR